MSSKFLRDNIKTSRKDKIKLKWNLKNSVFGPYLVFGLEGVDGLAHDGLQQLDDGRLSFDTA